MKAEFKINMAQAMALTNAMNEYNGDKYVTVRTWSYGFYHDDQGVDRHGYYDHDLTLRNSSGNTITLEGSTMKYTGGRNAPWVGGNSISHCFKAAGLIGADEVADEYRHIMPVSSKMPEEEWWRRSYSVGGKVISNYSVGADAPALPYDTIPDKEYRAI